MDGFAFDRLTRALGARPTRRRLLGLLTALPLAGIVTAQDAALTSAAGQRHRSKQRHHPQRGGKHHHRGHKKRKNQGSPQCTPDPLTVTCAGQCGTVVNTCGAPVDCGSCACTPACSPCQTCDAATGRCVPVADTTACDDGNPCTTGETCQAGVCTGGRPITNRKSCGGNNICCDGACCSGCCNARSDTGGTCGSCLAFVSSTTHTGNLGGLDGADQICQNLAEAGKLPGSYKAWLSTGDGVNASPASGRFRPSTLPYALVDSAETPIAANFQGLITCDTENAPFDCLDQEITLDERGESRTSGVWTDTATDGTEGRTRDDCDDWTVGDDSRNGQAGTTTATTFAWTSLRSDACNTPNRLYCFQQD